MIIQSAIEAKWWARVQTLEEKLESAGKAVRVAHLEQEAAEATTQRLREVLNKCECVNNNTANDNLLSSESRTSSKCDMFG